MFGNVVPLTATVIDTFESFRLCDIGTRHRIRSGVVLMMEQELFPIMTRTPLFDRGKPFPRILIIIPP